MKIFILIFISSISAQQCSVSIYYQKPKLSEIEKTEIGQLKELIDNYLYKKCYDFTNYDLLCQEVEDTMPQLREIGGKPGYEDISLLQNDNYKWPFWNIRECFTNREWLNDKCQPRYEDFENWLKNRKNRLEDICSLDWWILDNEYNSHKGVKIPLDVNNRD